MKKKLEAVSSILASLERIAKALETLAETKRIHNNDEEQREAIEVE